MLFLTIWSCLGGLPLAGFAQLGAGGNVLAAAGGMRLPGSMATTCVLLIGNLNEEVRTLFRTLLLLLLEVRGPGLIQYLLLFTQFSRRSQGPTRKSFISFTQDHQLFSTGIRVFNPNVIPSLYGSINVIIKAS